MNVEFKNKILSFSQWIILIGIICPWNVEAITLFLCLFILLITKELKQEKNSIFLLFFVYILLSSVFTILLYSYPLNKFIQQYILISYFSIGYFLFVSSIKKYYVDFFNKYLKFMLFAAIFGVIEYLIFYLFNVDIFSFLHFNHWNYWQSFRITSFCLCEPARFATLLTPALVYYFFNFKINHKIFQKILILLAYIFTFSFTSNIVLLLICIILLIYKFKKFVVLFPIFLLIFLTIFNFNELRRNNEYKKSSTEALIDIVKNFSISNIEYNRNNISVYAITKNLWVALNSPSRLFGTGLGTHEYSFDNLVVTSTEVDAQNKQDAYSLGIRIFSELGFLGVFFIFIFLYKFNNFKNIINFSIFFLIISLILRGGHYVSNGTILFIFLYYMTGKEKHL